MLNEYLNTLKEVLFKPKDFYKEMPKKGGYSNPFKFAFISFFISILGSLALLFLTKPPTNQELMVTPFVLVIAPLVMSSFIFIGALLFHVFFKLMKGKANYECTFRIVAFASSTSVISWIPWFGLFASLYTLYLYMIGGIKVHKLSAVKSAFAVLLPIIILIIVAATIVYYFITTMDYARFLETLGAFRSMQNVTF